MIKKYILFNFLIGLSLLVNAQSLSIDDTFTPDQLIRDVLIEGGCGQIVHVESDNNAEAAGLPVPSFAFFQRTDENFPFESGVVLTSGFADEIDNPTFFLAQAGNDDWEGDPAMDLMVQAIEPDEESNNATVISFDFVPLTETLNFRYIIASEEYDGFFQCNFDDAFAFILTGPGIDNVNDYDVDANPNTPDVSLDLGGKNIALIPGTNVPASITNIHDITCGEGDPGEFAFAQYFDAANSGNGSTVFDGQTVVLEVNETVIPGEFYHIRLIVADARDNIYDSAVFLEAGSFFLGDYILDADGNDLGDDIEFCEGEDITLHLPPLAPGGEIQWLRNGEAIDGEDNETLDVSESGLYSVEIFFSSGDCTVEDEINITVIPGPALETDSITQELCDGGPNFVFDLTASEGDFVADTTGLTFTYHTSMEDAESGDNAIAAADTTNYSVTEMTTIYVRVTNSTNSCWSVATLILVVGIEEVIDPVTLMSCADANGEGTFDLTSTESDLIGSINGATIAGYFESEADAENNQDPISDPANYSSASGSVYVLVDTVGGCQSIAEIILEVEMMNFTLDDLTICDGETLTLDAGSGFASYMWSTNENTQTINVSSTGSYTVTVTSDLGCEYSATINVTEGEGPMIVEVDVDGATVVVTAQNGETPYEYSLDGVNYQTSNTFTGVPAGIYEAYVRGANGCISDTVEFAVFIIPTLFTPNNDGINDVWNVEGLQIYSSVDIEIYDRYGKLVYNSNLSNTSVLWDGFSNNGKKLPTADYFYRLVINDNSEIHQGNITLKSRARKE